MIIPRIILDDLASHVVTGKVIVLYGPRRVGKTTLLNDLVKKLQLKTLFLNAETSQVQDSFSQNELEKLGNIVRGYELVVIDEAQKIKNIGERLKLIIDGIPKLRIVASGSSSFDLSRQVGEPLTGRKITYILYPIAQMELVRIENFLESQARLPERLVMGSYPEIFNAPNYQEKVRYLNELCDGYLYKDILELDGLRSSRKVKDILRLLAFQIGKQVSINEIAQTVELSRNTIYKYLELLEKSFVIKIIGGFSRNLRNEIKKNDRYYFYDNGVRNALIGNFNTLDMRDDTGMLWENFIVMERIKKLAYTNTFKNCYFWRTHDRQEIDWVEEGDGRLDGYEISWKKKNKKIPSHWRINYSQASFSKIHKGNFREFVM